MVNLLKGNRPEAISGSGVRSVEKHVWGSMSGGIRGGGDFGGTLSVGEGGWGVVYTRLPLGKNDCPSGGVKGGGGKLDGGLY